MHENGFRHFAIAVAALVFLLACAAASGRQWTRQVQLPPLAAAMFRAEDAYWRYWCCKHIDRYRSWWMPKQRWDEYVAASDLAMLETKKMMKERRRAQLD